MPHLDAVVVLRIALLMPGDRRRRPLEEFWKVVQHEASGEHRRESKLEENEPCNPTMQPDFLSKLDRAEERDARAAHQRLRTEEHLAQRQQ